MDYRNGVAGHNAPGLNHGDVERHQGEAPRTSSNVAAISQILLGNLCLGAAGCSEGV